MFIIRLLINTTISAFLGTFIVGVITQSVYLAMMFLGVLLVVSLLLSIALEIFKKHTSVQNTLQYFLKRFLQLFSVSLILCFLYFITLDRSNSYQTLSYQVLFITPCILSVLLKTALKI